MKTRDFPYAEIAPQTYEIGEFDCASIFLLVGDEKAMLIDTGIGVGDLRGFVETLTDKPLMVCYTHNHVDHVGGAGAFDNAHIHPKDMDAFSTGGGIGLSVEGRAGYVRMIAAREKGTYPYDLSVDLTAWGPEPPLTPLADGQVIDLGGRRVTVYETPGHTAGSVSFLDAQARILFVGDAVNCNLGLGGGEPGSPSFTSVERTLHYLQRVAALSDRYDAVYNGHYDYRPLGEPLGADVLPDVITACEQIVAGTASVTTRPWPFASSRPRPTVTIGRTHVAFNPEGIHDVT